MRMLDEIPARLGRADIGLKHRPRILFLATNLPYPLDAGGKIRTFHVLREMAKIGEVTMLSFSDHGREDAGAEILKVMGSAIHGITIKICSRDSKRDKKHVFYRRLAAFLSLKPWNIEKIHSDAFQKKLNALNLSEYDIIFLRGVSLMNYFTGKKSGKKILNRIVVDIDDLTLRAGETQGKAKLFSTRRFTHNIENYLLKKFYRRLRHVRGCFVVSEIDRDYLRYHKITDSIFLVPNTVEVPSSINKDVSRRGDSEILFCGSLTYGPNARGIQFFLDRIFPIIRAVYPDVQLRVVGKGSLPQSDGSGGCGNIDFTGFVQSVEPYYETATVVVVPLLSGMGTRIKILEAMAHRCPVVSTTIGAEGLEVTHDKNILIADHPDDFAKCCINLFADSEKRKAISNNGYHLVQEKYSSEVFHSAFTNAILQLAENNFCRASRGEALG